MNTQTDAAGLLQFLWQHFDAEGASDDELAHLSQAGEEAGHMGRLLAESILSAASSVHDADVLGKQPVCEIHGTDLSGYLFSVASQLNIISEMAGIASDAAYVMNKRLAARAKNSSRRAQTNKQSSQEGQ
ncbi:hypothetical protein BURK_001700 [Burkholderia sp. SJ98]|uniref:hypothetical protein n=1 Tax=Caballeronia zhejiangensis TaxID=871203 RepID=UPI00025B9C9A|nr:hypothetical protein [Caballeronia zhejiangensis]EKS73141.1 hypothetical protein BURK_001700 [Burkholderia sp. SJ98]